MRGSRSFEGFGGLLLGLVLAIGCSSSDEVVAVLEEGSFSAPTSDPAVVAAAGGVPESATPTPEPVGFDSVAPEPTSEETIGLFVSGSLRTTRVASAERWPFEAPLRDVFDPTSPSGEAAVLQVREPVAVLALRELGSRYGLATGVARLVVVDTIDDQYDLQIWNDE